jgi:prepilin-type N-terminal cleavage/methylation domain-containing protein
VLGKKSFTLVELAIVIVIIGISAALALPGYSTLKEKSLDREARTNLALIQAAEKIYRLEAGAYYPAAGSVTSITNINTNLKLSLPTGASISWGYKVDTDAQVITATRQGFGGRTLTLSY